MRAIHPIPEFLSLKLIDYMYENILNIPTFILGTDFGKELKKRKNQEFFENEFNHHSLMIYMAKTASIWDEEFAKKIYSMWWDPGFQKFVFERRSSFAYMDAVHYFIQQRNFKRIMRSGFHPCREDTFYCMIKTTGFVEISYRSGYVCVDSGGQRTERKKWPIHLQYEEGKVICFVVSLSEFDELCYEDDVTNRYEEGLSNWDTWYHNELVQKLPIYIIFNKMDVLERKVKNGIKFSDYVKSYDGDDNDPEAISEFIIQRYLEIDTFFNRVVKHFKISANNFDQCVNTINEIFHIDERVSPEDANSQQHALPVQNTNNTRRKVVINSDLLIEDVIYSILEFMTLEELLNTFLLVSKKWCKAGFKVPIDLFRPNMDNLVNSRFENVRSLSLQSTFMQRRHIEQLAHNPMFKKLTYLNLSNNYSLYMPDWSYLFEHNQFKYLEKIAMDDCYLNSSLVDFLLKMPRLKEVSLLGNHLSPLDLKRINHILKEDFEDPLLDLER